MNVTVCRKEHFNAAHRLSHPGWTDEQNRQVFGKCSNPNYHGHNYEIVVKVTGAVDPDTGFVYDMKVLGDLVRQEITERYDHKNLNLDTEDFKTLNPTAENMVVVMWNRLRPHLEQRLHLSVTLFETERNFVEYPAE